MKSLFLILVCMISVSFSATASPSHLLESDKLSSAIKTQLISGKTNLDVLIILEDQPDLQIAQKIIVRQDRVRFVYDHLRASALSTQSQLIESLEKRNLKYKRFYLLNAVAVEQASLDDLVEITALAEIKTLISNAEFKSQEIAHIDKQQPAMSNEVTTNSIGENITSTAAPQVWPISKGQGIVVAGQDTGVQWNHPALLQTYRGNNNATVDHNYNWHDAIRSNISGRNNPCGRNTATPCDDHGHGTHTVGTIVGSEGDSNIIGMAPEAQWIACRNMDNGYGRPSTYIECFEFFLAPFPYQGDSLTEGRPDLAAHVINNSWGCPKSELCDGHEILPVLERLYQAGILVVASAGNSGSACSTIADAPAHHSFMTLSVGAHNHKDGNIASFSSRGPSKYDGQIGPDVTAPGVSVRSAIPNNRYAGAGWSGTSMSGPHVVGLVALLWSAKPELIGQIDATSEIIRNSATGKTHSQTCGGTPGTNIPNNTFGHGHINAEAAFRSLGLL